MTDTPQTLIDEQKVNSTGNAGNTKIVTLPNGNILVAYSTVDGHLINVRGQLFSPDGERLGDEVTFDPIKITFGSLITDPKFDIAVSENGNVGLAFEFHDKETILTSVFSVTEDGASIISQDVHRSEGGNFRNGDYFNPSIIATEDGGFRTQWIERDTRDELQVEEVRVPATGGTENDLEDYNVNDDDYDVKSFNGNSDAEVESALLRNGNHVIILDRDGASGDRDEIHFRVMKPNERTHAEGETGDDGSGDRTFHSTVEALTGGGFVVAWAADDGFDTDVRFQVFNADGEPVTGPTTAGNNISGKADGSDNNNEPSLVALSDGGFILLWDKDAGAPGLMGQRYDAGGDTVGAVFRVTADNAAHIDATLLDDGRVAITWTVSGEGRVEMEIISGAASDGDDELTGTNLADVLHGLGGDDTITGGFGDDEIHGGAGDDIIDGGLGNDILYGGTGSDTFVIREKPPFFVLEETDEIRGFNATNDAEKIDLIDISDVFDFFELRENHMRQVGDDVLIDLGNNQSLILRAVALDDLDAEDFILRVNSIEGIGADDTLVGTDGADVIRGLGGDDIIIGGAGDDILYGGTGSDVFVFADGNGGDEIRGFNAKNDDEKIDLTGITGLSSFAGLQARMVQSGNGTDVFINLGAEDGNYIYLRDVDLADLDIEDFILGGKTIVGTNAGDILNGTDGNDIIEVGDGEDQITGGAGDDHIDGGRLADTIDAGAGNDTVFGGFGRDIVDLGDGDDIFHDDPQNDRFGDDTVFGGAGNDTFFGGGGEDVFTGGTGNDTIHAGIGDETFVFAIGDGQDLIFDFGAKDVIDLSGVAAITSFDDLVANHMSQAFQSRNTVIEDGEGLRITLDTINIAELDADNFLF